MANTGSRMIRGFLLLVLSGVMVCAVANRKSMMATDGGEPSAERVASHRTSLAALPRPDAVATDPSGYSLNGAAMSPVGADFASTDLASIESVRDDLRRNLLGLADGQIAVETSGRQDRVAARLAATQRELEEANSQERAVVGASGEQDCAARIRDIETQFQGSRLNLRLKLIAVNARMGMFDGGMDAETRSKSESLKAELERLDRKQAESIQTVRDAESAKMTELKAQQQAATSARLAGLRYESASQVAEQARARKDRLKVDLAEGTSSEGFERMQRADLDAGRPNGALAAVNSRAAAAAEAKFSRDLAAARASMVKRQNEIKRREAEDYALAGKRRVAASSR